MKKQLLMLLVALFASVQIFAQTSHDPPTCTGSAAAPAVGVTYTYQVSIPNTGGYTGTGTFDWYVMTQGQLDLLNGTHYVNPNAEFVASGWYDTPTGGQNTIDITWTSAALATAQPYFLVVVYVEPAVCANANNIKVYRIFPQNTFWLKLDNITTVQCVASVVSANITNKGDPGQVTYVYGTNTLTVKETASGYTGLFDPGIQISGLLGDQNITSVTWAAAAPSNATGTFTGSVVGGVYTSTGSSAQMPSLATGQEITITIILDNVHYETLADQLLTIAIDGSYTAGATTFNDLSDVNGNCTPELAWADNTSQTIKARPTITPVTPPAFVPKNP
jgi:hypothetical protein